jgi:hypothetical protein
MIRNALLRVQVLTDIKTCKTIPDKESYLEHRLQTAAYAATVGNTGDDRVITANLYVSTKNPGDIMPHTQDDWPDTFAKGFRPLLDYWCWANKHSPEMKRQVT